MAHDDMAGSGSPLTADELVARLTKIRLYYPPREEGTPRAPLLYQPITLLWAIGRAFRGEPRTLPWTETDEALSALLLQHAQRGEQPRPFYPVLALHHAGLWSLEGHAGPVPRASGSPSPLRRWFEEQQPVGGLVEPVHELMRTDGRARIAAVDALVGRFYEGLDADPFLAEVGLYEDTVADDAPGRPVRPAPDHVRENSAEARAAEYDRLCALAERRAASGCGGRREGTSEDPIRSAAVRRAVLDRSEGWCENPGCGGQPADVTDGGKPLLDVDHVDDIAGGGPDHPGLMIAVCPNCHAVKTRGSRREEYREIFRRVAREKHLRLRPE